MWFYTEHKGADTVISIAEGEREFWGLSVGAPGSPVGRELHRQSETVVNRPQIASNPFVLSHPWGEPAKKDFHFLPTMMSFPLLIGGQREGCSRFLKCSPRQMELLN